MSEERFIDLETRLAQQDQLLHELEDVVSEQQTKIMQLEQLCRSLLDRIRAVSDAMPAENPGDERPPHY